MAWTEKREGEGRPGSWLKIEVTDGSARGLKPRFRPCRDRLDRLWQDIGPLAGPCQIRFLAREIRLYLCALRGIGWTEAIEWQCIVASEEK